MNNKLTLLCTNLAYRVQNRDDFRQATVTIAGNPPKIATLQWPSVTSTQLAWRENKSHVLISVDEVAQKVSAFVGENPHALIQCQERRYLITMELKGDKINVKRQAVEHPPLENVHNQPIQGGGRQHFIKAIQAQHLLKAIDVMSDDGQIKGDKRRKYYQIDRFVELVDQVLESEVTGKSRLHIVDCGCGKSYLSFVLNYYLYEVLGRDCFVTGIDNNEAVIERSRQVQEKLGYRNMAFVATDIRNHRFEESVDMVLSLHACDTATDWAIALGIQHQAKYIIAVPCCQADLTERIDYGPLKAITKHGVFKHKLADILTDGLRTLALEAAGYNVSVAEYVSPLDTPKNTMIRAIKGISNSTAVRDYALLKKHLGDITPAIDREL